VDIKTFKAVTSKLPPHIAVLMRGPTGVGKSHVAAAIAADEGKPFIDVRGSTMQEGDVIGYPDLEAMKENGVATFCLPAWYVRACNEPVVLMLDELNRSMPGVMQSFFQIVLDRELGNDKDGNPVRLHPETRVIAAVNFGSEYDVNDMDPALLRRFYVADIEPTVGDWIEWANENSLDSVLVDFIRQNPAHWRVEPSSVEPGTVVPTPASWHRLDDSYKYAEWTPSDLAGGNLPTGFYAMALGMVGSEAAIAFQDFVKNYEKVISAEDVLEGRLSNKDAKELPAGTVNSVIDKLAEHCKEEGWTAKQSKNVAAFGKTLGGELMVQLWNKVSSSNNLPNIQKLHKLMGQEVVKVVQASRNLK
jgi:hypothetical protein